MAMIPVNGLGRIVVHIDVRLHRPKCLAEVLGMGKKNAVHLIKMNRMRKGGLEPPRP